MRGNSSTPAHYDEVTFHFIKPFNQLVAFIIPILVTFHRLKFQGQDQSNNPFATHPTTMIVAVATSIIYYLANVVLLRFPLRHFTVVAHHFLVWCGYASIAALASILFPDAVSPFVYTIFVLLAAADLLYGLYRRRVMAEEEEEEEEEEHANIGPV